MTRQEYDKIVDVFASLDPRIEKTRDEHWPNYQEDEPKDFVVELSIRLGIAKPFRYLKLDGLDCFSPEELN